MTAGVPEFSVLLALYVSAVMMTGGLVKGVSGFGLPLTTVPLLALVMPVPTAVAWTLLPLLVSQVAQMLECRGSAGVLRVIWPLMAGLGLTLVFSVQLLAVFDPRVLMLIVGVLVQVFVLTQLAPRPLQLPARGRPAALAVVGIVSGGIGGLTSFYGVPAAQALISLGLSQSQFIFATSATFFVGATIMAVGLDSLGLISPTDVTISALGLIPTMVGMQLGRMVRNRLSMRLFRAAVLGVLSATGGAMILRALL